MNFMEAVECMKEGKKVSRGEYVAYLDELNHVCYETKTSHGVNQCTALSDIEGDWEVVEEKKTLSDKVDVGNGHKRQYWHGDVRTAIKEYVKRVGEIQLVDKFSNDILAKEIFGSELL